MVVLGCVALGAGRSRLLLCCERLVVMGIHSVILCSRNLKLMFVAHQALFTGSTCLMREQKMPATFTSFANAQPPTTRSFDSPSIMAISLRRPLGLGSPFSLSITAYIRESPARITRGVSDASEVSNPLNMVYSKGCWTSKERNVTPELVEGRSGFILCATYHMSQNEGPSFVWGGSRGE